MLEERIRQFPLPDRIMSADQAALLKDGMVVGLSGFTRAGDAKAVPLAMAERAKRDPLQITLITGASLGKNVDRAAIPGPDLDHDHAEELENDGNHDGNTHAHASGADRISKELMLILALQPKTSPAKQKPQTKRRPSAFTANSDTAKKGHPAPRWREAPRYSGPRDGANWMVILPLDHDQMEPLGEGVDVS